MSSRAVRLMLLMILPAAAIADAVDCSDAYGGKATLCVRVPCDAKYQTFLGTWKGPFHAYVRELSKDGKTVFRPYENTTVYAGSDCLKNSEAGETFIIGHMTDTLRVGPKSQAFFDGIVGYGFHVRQQ